MTVGLVIVSHSEKLASGAAELAGQMTKGAIAIAAAGGAGDNIIGTSVDTIQQAIERVDGPDGVLVLLDMGSAIYSAEMALEFLTEEQQGRVLISFAPLVEGTVAAAIDAMLGHSLQEVKAAAEKTASKEQLQNLKPITQDEEVPAESEPSPQVVAVFPADALEKQCTLTNPTGLHARPASVFVRTAAQFKAIVEVHTSMRQARADSMFALLSLGARQGETLLIRASGEDAQTALDALCALIEANFYETAEAAKVTLPSVRQVKEVPATSMSTQTINELQGIPTSTGFALGPALLYTSQRMDLSAVERRTIASTQVVPEQARLHEAVDATIRELQAMAQRLQSQVGERESAIFDAQVLLLRDPLLLQTASDTIRQQQCDAASAFALVGEQNAAQLEALDDTLLAARAVDIRDVTNRVVQRLGGQTTSRHDFSTLAKPVILVAHDLTPSDTAQLRREMVVGICTIQGGPTAHTAILARALGIPAIAGLNETLLQRVHAGDELGMDAEKGIVYLHLTPELHEGLAERVEEQKRRQSALKIAAQQIHEPLLIDGQRIHLLANIGSAAEAEAARQWGAEGVGLLRTEFLFANAQVMPGAEEQRASYAQVFRAFRGTSERAASGPIVARTLDAGADKPMPALQPFLAVAQEANPALGVRGVRIHLAHPELLEQQLRALLQAATDEHVQLHVMVPMLTTVEELRMVRIIFERVSAALNITTPVPLGIMVEVPASAVMAPELATLADFFSIGANDLLQYTLASDRTNTALAALYNPMQPSLLRLIRQVAAAGRNAGKPVAVCGEMASDTGLAPVLVGLGITELSMTPNAIPAVRTALTGRTLSELTDLGNRVCALSTVAEVEQICTEFANRRE
ncbi:MAG: phosphoenolpyruvate--protein phosphotransferase [Ktedonobacteraceae bacterium]